VPLGAHSVIDSMPVVVPTASPVLSGEYSADLPPYRPRRGPGLLARRRSVPGRTLAAGAAACRYWSCAGAAAELRMLRPRPRPDIPGRAYLHVRVHLVPRLRGERPARRLSELRRRARPAPHPPAPPARNRPAIDQAGCPARMCSGIRSLIRPSAIKSRPHRVRHAMAQVANCWKQPRNAKVGDW
jgi:hypothetical protein